MSKRSKLIRVLVIALPVQVLLFSLLATTPEAIERYYSRGLYPIISRLLTRISAFAPLPLGQLAIIITVLWCLYQLRNYRALFPLKNTWKTILSYTVACISVLYFAFMTAWGLNYHRQTLYEQLHYSDEGYTPTQLEALAKAIIAQTNAHREILLSDTGKPVQFTATREELKKEAAMAFTKESLVYSPSSYQHQAVKYVWIPQVMSYLGIAGIYFPFTGEANINGDLPSYLQPYTMCHEMAHQFGYAREDEANYVSFRVCSRHANAEFRYSAYFAALQYVMSEIHYQDEELFYVLRAGIAPGALRDLRDNRLYWDQYDTQIADYASEVNDLFLKMNYQEEGTTSYGLVINLLLAEYNATGRI